VQPEKDEQDTEAKQNEKDWEWNWNSGTSILFHLDYLGRGGASRYRATSTR
jgi:hypothetical protein